VMTAVMEVESQSRHTGTPLSASTVALLGARNVAIPRSAPSGPATPNSEIPRLESHLTYCKQKTGRPSNSEKNDNLHKPFERDHA